MQIKYFTFTLYTQKFDNKTEIMKKMLLAVAIISFGTLFSSCQKCVECTYPGYGYTSEYCDRSRATLETYIHGMENAGYNCQTTSPSNPFSPF